jgi:hypothetical protein
MNVMATVDRMTGVLDRAGIDYAVVGELAVIAWGLPRFTHRIELVAPLPHDRKGMRHLEEELRAAGLWELESNRFTNLALSCVEQGRMLNFETPGAIQVDILPSGSAEVRGVASTVLGMRGHVETAGGQKTWFASPEGTIIHKLYCYWSGDDGSMRDVASILQVQNAAGRDLNLKAVGDWAREYDPGLYQAWIEVLDAVGIGGG